MKNKENKPKTKNKTGLILNISIATLKVNGLRISIKSQRLAEWI